VQGADDEVIRGAADTIRRCRPIIVFEWEALLARQFSVTLDDVRSMLSDIGYTIEVLKTHNEKQTDYVARPLISPLSI
jgi:Methyltransferase FkbM domain